MKSHRFLPDNPAFDYEEFPFFWLARVHSMYMLEQEKVLKKLGTDVPTRRVLLMLHLRGTATMSQLSEHTIIKLSTLTRIIQRMRDAELVSTCANAEDARITDVSMTAKGVALLDQIQEATQKVYVKGYRDLTEAQLAQLNETLKVIFRNFAES
ncbi:MarR family winged helix-turn-helix transcriptional regulator [Thauera sp.]|uniref:MarR family winged helix-turn-helix transcriptional regulator n=1 Tax=Thauera sp. TaxID=1905334 RepID=UPI0039E32A2C